MWPDFRGEILQLNIDRDTYIRASRVYKLNHPVSEMTEADDKPYGEDGVGASVLNEVVDWTVLIRGTGVPGVYIRTNAFICKKTH